MTGKDRESLMIARRDQGNGDAFGMRAYNRNLILDVIRQNGALAKAEIARTTGLSAQSASVIVNALLKDRLVRKEKKIRGKVGQPVTPISLNPAGAYSVGIKIGRRSLEVVMVDFNGGLVRHDRVDYRAPIRDHVIGELRVRLHQILAGTDDKVAERIVGVGVAMPSFFNEWATQIGLRQDELDDWVSVDICAEISAICGLDCTLYNDATAACAAEMALGKTIGRRNTLYIYAGTFIGGGVVLDGRLYQGSRQNAGAVASMPIGPDNAQVLESASVVFLDQRMRAAGLSYRSLAEAMETPGAQPYIDDWLDEAAGAIAHVAVSAVSVIDFESVVIDGVLPRAMVERLCEQVRGALARFNLTGLAKFRIASGSVGRSACALGAAILPMVQKFSPGQELLAKAVIAPE